MWNLLNALVIFGMEIPWSMEEALFWLLVAQVALILFMIIVFAILIRRMRDEAPVVQIPEPERKLLSLTLDFSLVRRKFALGADFECGGLVVTANYNTDPVAEVVTDFTVVSAEALKNGEGLGELLDCVVIAPDMSEPGKKSVTVNYHGKAAVYMVAMCSFPPSRASARSSASRWIRALSAASSRWATNSNARASSSRRISTPRPSPNPWRPSPSSFPI